MTLNLGDRRRRSVRGLAMAGVAAAGAGGPGVGRPGAGRPGAAARPVRRGGPGGLDDAADGRGAADRRGGQQHGAARRTVLARRRPRLACAARGSGIRVHVPKTQPGAGWLATTGGRKFEALKN